MAICQIMLMDFALGNPPKTEMGYDDRDLEQGTLFGEWLLEMKIKKWPLYDFKVKEFIQWAKGK